jgi:LmbE family N-acetylglucosaminyl deacetylase
VPPELLPPLPEEFDRVLCVVAHPDDVEYGTSAAVATWTARGVEVAYLMLTRGEAGIDGMDPERTAELRVREQIAASHAVGVTDVEFLEHPDGVLEYGLGLRRDVTAAIRRFRPDAVLTSTWAVETAMGLNQADHRVAGLVTADAVRDAGNRWVFPELLADGLQPWSPRWLLVTGDGRDTHGVDVSGEPLERGVAALEAHAEYIAGIPGHPPAGAMLRAMTGLNGRAMGVAHAVLLHAYDLHTPPPDVVEALRAAGAEPEPTA